MKILETEVGYVNKKVNIAFMALILPSHFFRQSLTEKHTHPFMSLPVSYAAPHCLRGEGKLYEHTQVVCIV